ncbi:chymotrypsin-1-like [Phymastichus coffea]|uniref:chymotrypsin-1-like n=1 Tax=Phymastichus coffea TaxID=108790 RepID=UPI00273B48E0|nr:chymotrypsin-1-like [Phymastichus coffea]XP_058800809.1 chymotrypsin-1-like [Phymastichus coffea]
MPQKMLVLFRYLTYGMLIGLSHEIPLIGTKVRDARPNELPFVVSIARRAQSNDTHFVNRHFCTGTLISRRSILTVEHCFGGLALSDIEIIAGSEDVSLGDKYYPESWITYKEWKKNKKGYMEFLHHDIIVLTLEGKGVRPEIHPATILTFAPTDLIRSIVRIAGWGVSIDGKCPLVLKTALTTVLCEEECRKRASDLSRNDLLIMENYFCSSAKPGVLSSYGDSGAPILNKRKQLVGLNIGVCPNLIGFPLRYQLIYQMNLHIHLYHYRNFIKDVKITS